MLGAPKKKGQLAPTLFVHLIAHRLMPIPLERFSQWGRFHSSELNVISSARNRPSYNEK